MKKALYLAICAIAAIAFYGCKGDEQPKFQTADLRTFDLYGHVSSMTLNYETVTFDTAGVVTTKEMNVKRDEEGRIIRYTLKKKYAVGDMWKDDKYAYDENGNLAEAEKESLFMYEKTQYIYDEKGRLIKTISDCNGEGDEWQEVCTYKIKNTDAEGNWTVREVHTEYPGMDEAIMGPQDRVEERTIEYYTPEEIQG